MSLTVSMIHTLSSLSHVQNKHYNTGSRQFNKASTFSFYKGTHHKKKVHLTMSISQLNFLSLTCCILFLLPSIGWTSQWIQEQRTQQHQSDSTGDGNHLNITFWVFNIRNITLFPPRKNSGIITTSKALHENRKKRKVREKKTYTKQKHIWKRRLR